MTTETEELTNRNKKDRIRRRERGRENWKKEIVQTINHHKAEGPNRPEEKAVREPLTRKEIWKVDQRTIDKKGNMESRSENH